MDSFDEFLARQRKRVRGHLQQAAHRIAERRDALQEMDVEIRQAPGASTCASTRAKGQRVGEGELIRLGRSV